MVLYAAADKECGDEVDANIEGWWWRLSAEEGDPDLKLPPNGWLIPPIKCGSKGESLDGDEFGDPLTIDWPAPEDEDEEPLPFVFGPELPPVCSFGVVPFLSLGIPANLSDDVAIRVFVLDVIFIFGTALYIESDNLH